MAELQQCTPWVWVYLKPMFKDNECSQSYLQQACCFYSPVRDWSYSNRDVTVLYNPIMDKALLSNLFGLGFGCGNKPPTDLCVCLCICVCISGRQGKLSSCAFSTNSSPLYRLKPQQHWLSIWKRKAWMVLQGNLHISPMRERALSAAWSTIMCSMVRKQNGQEEKDGAAAMQRELTVLIRRQAQSFSLLCQSVCRRQFPQVVTGVRVGVYTGLMHGYDDLLLLSAAVERERENWNTEHEFMESRQSVLPQQGEYRMSR